MTFVADVVRNRSAWGGDGTSALLSRLKVPPVAETEVQEFRSASMLEIPSKSSQKSACCPSHHRGGAASPTGAPPPSTPPALDPTPPDPAPPDPPPPDPA